MLVNADTSNTKPTETIDKNGFSKRSTNSSFSAPKDLHSNIEINSTRNNIGKSDKTKKYSWGMALKEMALFYMSAHNRKPSSFSSCSSTVSAEEPKNIPNKKKEYHKNHTISNMLNIDITQPINTNTRQSITITQKPGFSLENNSEMIVRTNSNHSELKPNRKSLIGINTSFGLNNKLIRSNTDNIIKNKPQNLSKVKADYIWELKQVFVSIEFKHKLSNLVSNDALFHFMRIKAVKYDNSIEYFEMANNNTQCLMSINWPNQIYCEGINNNTVHNKSTVTCKHIYSIIYELTDYLHINNAFFSNFIKSYHYFISSEDLTRFILMRYINAHLSTELSIDAKNIQKYRIYNFVKKWIAYAPFKISLGLINHLRLMLELFVKLDKFSKSILSTVYESLNKMQNSLTDLSLISNVGKRYNKFDSILEKIDFYGLKSHVSNVRLTEISPQLLVEQLTILEHELFCEINKAELIKQHKINGTRRRSSCPSLLALSTISNSVSTFIVDEIKKDYSKYETSEFKNILEYMIEACKFCYKINNFNTLFEIILGINNALQVVENKNKLLKKVKPVNLSQFQRLNEFVSYSNNHKNYRLHLEKLSSDTGIVLDTEYKGKFWKAAYSENKNYNFICSSYKQNLKKAPNYPTSNRSSLDGPYLDNSSGINSGSINMGNSYGLIPEKPVFPFVGLLLSDLAFSEEGCSNYYKDKNHNPTLLSIHKINLLGKCLSKIFDYQKMQYKNNTSITTNCCFESHDFIQSWIVLYILKLK